MAFVYSNIMNVPRNPVVIHFVCLFHFGFLGNRVLLEGYRASLRKYSSLNAILAQLYNCHVELVLRLSSKIYEIRPTVPAQFLVETHPARCHYCQMCMLYFSAES